MTSDATPSRSPLQQAIREGARELSGYWGWFLVLGILWTLFGMYVLSYRVGSLAAVATRGSTMAARTSVPTAAAEDRRGTAAPCG
jgi:hypothetical protein